MHAQHLVKPPETDAILLMGREEELEAKMQFGAVSSSIWRSSCCLSSNSSNTASITSSLRPGPRRRSGDPAP